MHQHAIFKTPQEIDIYLSFQHGQYDLLMNSKQSAMASAWKELSPPASAGAASRRRRQSWLSRCALITVVAAAAVVAGDHLLGQQLSSSRHRSSSPTTPNSLTRSRSTEPSRTCRTRRPRRPAAGRQLMLIT
uniref:Uncharacterized protein n=1 Tax=Oryza meridionalis TaxID=40149 RepID=A0A0E0CH63_9ORYZ